MNFIVLGSFYNLILVGDKIVKCRNILEIYSKEYFSSIEYPVSLFFGKPDSVFVMMNPGSSEPREDGFIEPVFELKEAENRISHNIQVKAKPDVTQYQVMRVMLEMGWEHVRVVNLSDIREAKSLRFLRTVNDFEINYGDIHTIFSSLRKNEMKKVFFMKREDSPVVLGWGKDKRLAPLAKKALESLNQFNIKGLGIKNEPLQYFHPSPNIQTAKVQWLKNILIELKKDY